MLLRLLTILLIAQITPAWALETDNYFSWRQNLQDSSESINRFLISKIQETLPKQHGKTCQQITYAISKNFASFFVHDDPIAQHLLKELSQEQMLPQDVNYVPLSIYRDPYRFYIPRFGLAPTIQVNGYYFGMDKLSHFGATGKLYLDHYLRALRQGADETTALMAAIDYGIHEENTVYGYWASGVYSFADLEADYQGLQFYRRFCMDEENTYLQQSTDGAWNLISRPDIRDYVSGNWDETYNLSYRLPGNWEKVKAVIAAEYCSLMHTDLVQKRMSYYQTTPASFSMNYLQQLRDRREERVPTPQSVGDLCESALSIDRL